MNKNLWVFVLLFICSTVSGMVASFLLVHRYTDAAWNDFQHFKETYQLRRSMELLDAELQLGISVGIVEALKKQSLEEIYTLSCTNIKYLLLKVDPDSIPNGTGRRNAVDKLVNEAEAAKIHLEKMGACLDVKH